MPHPLVRKNTGTQPSGGRPTGDTIAQVYVNRQKVWEQSFGSEEEAYAAAKAEKSKHQSKDEDAVIVVRKRKT